MFTDSSSALYNWSFRMNTQVALTHCSAATVASWANSCLSLQDNANVCDYLEN